MDLATDQLDKLIERRADKEPDPDETEESYMESVWRYNSRQRHETLWARLRWHERMLEAHTRTFQELLDRHQAGRARCEAALGIQTSNARKEPHA